jgi:hypothetical protein
MAEFPANILEQHKELNLEAIPHSPYYVESVWTLSEIASYGLHIVDVINRLTTSFVEIFIITGVILNDSEFLA